MNVTQYITLKKLILIKLKHSMLLWWLSAKIFLKDRHELKCLINDTIETLRYFNIHLKDLDGSKVDEYKLII